MSKRFTDTDRFLKSFYRRLPAPYKLLWEYILSQCDCAGIWLVEEEVAQARIGKDAKITLKKAVELFNEDQKRIYVFHQNEKWFIIDFIRFQYGVLNDSNRAHKGVIQRLKECKLYDFYDESTGSFNFPTESDNKGPSEGPTKDLQSPLERAKDKDKDKYKEKINKKPVFNFEVSEAMIEPFTMWLEYKKQKGQTYKSDMSLKQCYSRLCNLSNNDAATALKIVTRSIAQNWSGLFELEKESSTLAVGQVYSDSNAPSIIKKAGF